jgi:hypothetical protein
MAQEYASTTLLTVPAANAVTNVVERDVIGNKTDTVANDAGITRSLVAHAKGAIFNTNAGDVDTVDNNRIRDVVGNKEDASSFTASAVNSLMAYIKGFTLSLKAATVDTATAIYLTSTVGNKADTAISIVAADKSLMAYIKGILYCVRTILPSVTAATITGVIKQDTSTGTPNVVTLTPDAAANTFGNWDTIDAAAAVVEWISHVAIHVSSFTSYHEQNYVVEIGTGGAGSEAVKARFSFVGHTGDSDAAPVIPSSDTLVFPLPIPIKVALGVRIAGRTANSGASASYTVVVGLSFYQTLE